jgi:ribosomal protein L11 methyltransferase
VAAASPALRLTLNGLPADARDRLLALLSSHDLVAIHEDDLTNPQIWTVHFADAASRVEGRTQLQADAEFAGVGVEAVDVEDEDWARRTQADLPAIQIGRVLVCPPWDVRTPAAPDEIVVLIEPSRGFGTGHHQSTRLCLALLQNRNLAGLTMIDVGTGSGVLAISAAKLGAAYVAAIDIDADAIENARENVAVNGVGGIVEAHVEDFTSASRVPADVVTANLTGTLLARHAKRLTPLVRPGGMLITAGFTGDEKHMVEDAFQPSFAITESAEEEGWWAYVLTRAT